MYRFPLESKIILLPNLENSDTLYFNGWYTDSACTTKIDSYEISANTELYATFKGNTKKYTITFDTKGGNTIDLITKPFGTVETLPEIRQKTVVPFCTGRMTMETGWNGTLLSLHSMMFSTQYGSVQF